MHNVYNTFSLLHLVDPLDQLTCIASPLPATSLEEWVAWSITRPTTFFSSVAVLTPQRVVVLLALKTVVVPTHHATSVDGDCWMCLHSGAQN